MKPAVLRIFLGLGLLHLTLVAANASHSRLDRLSRVSILSYYGRLSGAGSCYGFFAPGVGYDLRSSFDVIDDRGEAMTARIETGVSHEADLRVGGVIGALKRDSEDAPKLRRALTASMAGKMFVRYPQAKAIVVRLERFDPVSMKAFRAGARSQWKTFYEAKFIHGKE